MFYGKRLICFYLREVLLSLENAYGLAYYPNSPARVSFILACGYHILPRHELATSSAAASTSEML